MNEDRVRLAEIGRDEFVIKNFIWASTCDVALIFTFVAVMVLRTGDAGWAWFTLLLLFAGPVTGFRFAKRALDNKPTKETP